MILNLVIMVLEIKLSLFHGEENGKCNSVVFVKTSKISAMQGDVFNVMTLFNWV